MFQNGSNTGYHPVLAKIRQKTLVFGARALPSEFSLDQGPRLLPCRLRRRCYPKRYRALPSPLAQEPLIEARHHQGHDSRQR